MGLFDKRDSIKPYEYDVQSYIDAILHSFRIHDEFSYSSDVQDYHVNMTDVEKDVVMKCMLAISNIEISVKSFWGELGRSIPKPEIANVGTVFGLSEVIHFNLYSHLIEILCLNGEFEKVKGIPQIQKRIEYLTDCLKDREKSREDFVRCLYFFTLFIENVSLFSQFLILMSMNKSKMYLKGMVNGINFSAIEESLHSDFGAYLINIIKNEYPEIKVSGIREASIKALEAEIGIIEWIFEKGELDYINKKDVIEYVKYRLNKGLKDIGEEAISDYKLPENLEWFESQLLTTSHSDFFSVKSRNYSKRTTPVDADDLF